VRRSKSGVPVDHAWGCTQSGTGRIQRLLAVVTAERLWESPLEELGCVEDAEGDLRGLVLEAVCAGPKRRRSCRSQTVPT
jgi:hypothetical protein